MCVFIYLHFSLLFKDFFRVILGLQQNYEEGIEISHLAPCHIHALFSFIPAPCCGLSKSVTGLLVAGGASSKFPHQPLMGLCLFHSQPSPLLPSSPTPLLSPFPGVRLAWGLQTLVQWLLCDSTV